MPKPLAAAATLVAIIAVAAATLPPAPHDRHLYPNAVAKDTPSRPGWGDGTAQNSNW